MFSPGPPRDRLELPERFRAGELEVDRAAMRAVLTGRALALEPKAFDLLFLLAANTGRVVTKDEIFERVWPGVVVSDNSLTRLVAQLRRELADDPEAPRYLETARTRGYRFLPVPEPVEPEAEPSPPAPAEPAALLPDGESPRPIAGEAHRTDVAACGDSSPADGRGLRGLGRPSRSPRSSGWRPSGGSPACTYKRSERRMPGALTQLTVDPAFDGQPAISPDGAVVVFVSERSGVPELWQRPILGKERALTSGDGGASIPPSPPDGRWICYTSLRRRALSEDPGRGRNGEQADRVRLARVLLAGRLPARLPVAGARHPRRRAVGRLARLNALDPRGRDGRAGAAHPARGHAGRARGSALVAGRREHRLRLQRLAVLRHLAGAGHGRRARADRPDRGLARGPAFDPSGLNLFALRSTPELGLTVVRVPLAGGRTVADRDRPPGGASGELAPGALPGRSPAARRRDRDIRCHRAYPARTGGRCGRTAGRGVSGGVGTPHCSAFLRPTASGWSCAGCAPAPGAGTCSSRASRRASSGSCATSGRESGRGRRS